jgi:hypothetical protein
MFGMLGDVEVVVPEKTEEIHEAYMRIVDGGIDEPRHRLCKIAQELSVDAVVLAGTDLALVFDERTRHSRTLTAPKFTSGLFCEGYSDAAYGNHRCQLRQVAPDSRGVRRPAVVDLVPDHNARLAARRLACACFSVEPDQYARLAVASRLLLLLGERGFAIFAVPVATTRTIRVVWESRGRACRLGARRRGEARPAPAFAACA